MEEPEKPGRLVLGVQTNTLIEIRTADAVWTMTSKHFPQSTEKDRWRTLRIGSETVRYKRIRGKRKNGKRKSIHILFEAPQTVRIKNIQVRYRESRSNRTS